jgi:hypothetical protein
MDVYDDIKAWAVKNCSKYYVMSTTFSYVNPKTILEKFPTLINKNPVFIIGVITITDYNNIDLLFKLRWNDFSLNRDSLDVLEMKKKMSPLQLEE